MLNLSSFSLLAYWCVFMTRDFITNRCWIFSLSVRDGGENHGVSPTEFGCGTIAPMDSAPACCIYGHLSLRAGASCTSEWAASPCHPTRRVDYALGILTHVSAHSPPWTFGHVPPPRKLSLPPRISASHQRLVFRVVYFVLRLVHSIWNEMNCSTRTHFSSCAVNSVLYSPLGY